MTNYYNSYCRYIILNENTNYTLFQSDCLKTTKRIFYAVSRRQYGDILLIDTSTSEILKTKLSIEKQPKKTNSQTLCNHDYRYVIYNRDNELTYVATDNLTYAKKRFNSIVTTKNVLHDCDDCIVLLDKQTGTNLKSVNLSFWR